MNTSKIILTIAAAMLAIGFVGCKKKEQPAAPRVPAAERMMKQAEPKATEANKATEVNKPAEVNKPTASIEQTTCPVMEGNKIDKNVFVEYKGKTVYFCCEACKAKFLADPEKYVAKLPQFAK